MGGGRETGERKYSLVQFPHVVSQSISSYGVRMIPNHKVKISSHLKKSLNVDKIGQNILASYKSLFSWCQKNNNNNNNISSQYLHNTGGANWLKSANDENAMSGVSGWLLHALYNAKLCNKNIQNCWLMIRNSASNIIIMSSFVNRSKEAWFHTNIY